MAERKKGFSRIVGKKKQEKEVTVLSQAKNTEKSKSMSGQI